MHGSSFNPKLALLFWWVLAGILGCFILARGVVYCRNRPEWRRIKYLYWNHPQTEPAPQLSAHRALVAATCSKVATVARAVCYRQLAIPGRLAWLTPPSLGKITLLLCYWAVLVLMLTVNAIHFDISYYERIGFRAAWVSISQVPLVYLLASKSSILARLAGTSHERLNWLHRWVSRTFLVVVTVHGGFFVRGWVVAGNLQTQLQTMSMVRWGLAAWAILVWTILSSLSPIRRLAYEAFVLQHIIAAVVFLWLLWRHVRHHAPYYVWSCITAISIDRISRGMWFIYTNFWPMRVRRYASLPVFGYEANVQAKEGGISIITLKGVSLSWKPGQHVFLWIPRLGLVESHPYTIASSQEATVSEKSSHREMQFAVRAQSGLSRRLYKQAAKYQKDSSSLLHVRAFIDGPYGDPPTWAKYETLVLIAASTGASFTLPIIESVLNGPRNISRIHVLLLTRNIAEMEFYLQKLSICFVESEALNITLSVEIAITGRKNKDIEMGKDAADDGADEEEDSAHLLKKNHNPPLNPIIEIRNDTPIYQKQSPVSANRGKYQSLPPASSAVDDDVESIAMDPLSSSDTSDDESDDLVQQRIVHSYGRPNIDEFIQRSVVDTRGQAIVAVCAGKMLGSVVSNAVAGIMTEMALSGDEAARKINLYTECFSY